MKWVTQLRIRRTGSRHSGKFKVNKINLKFLRVRRVKKEKKKAKAVG